MSNTAISMQEFDTEMAATRRVLERVPSDKADWKPHPKSFSTAHLAQLIAGMPAWLTNIATERKLDLSTAPKYSNQTTEDLLAQFDKGVRESRAALDKATDDDLALDWSLTMGEHAIMTMPRREVVRQTMGHIAHHRGQMTVYLRLLDVPVPSVYGPSADDRGGF